MSIDTRALQIVEAALGIDSPQARAAYVVLQCGDNTELRARVEQLLSREAANFRLLPTESFVHPLSVIDEIPDRIGPYRVTGEIARGGMGAVVKAERDDGVFAQTVAIKLIRADLASDRAKARFAEERRILARLRHPDIVRILDGGEQDDRAWLAMDYVDGGPVTEVLDRRNADRTTRLVAFEAVCEAVAYAHRALVVHADIKPSNVLMSDDGLVHLLDFGIARLMVGIDPDESGDPYPLTKGYAAPERGVGVAPTIASDVFSLGVLMLGMLGINTPDDDCATVPGTRLPVGQLDGDLGAIAARALAERPEDRYADVAALLADIRRMRAFVPVRARGNVDWRYVAGRFVLRHRAGLALSALVGLFLVGATIVSTVQYVRAERAREEANARFDEVRSLAKFMQFDLYDMLSVAPGTVKARARIAEVSGRYLARLRAVKDAPLSLQLESARGYRRLAAVTGLSGTASLGQARNATAALDNADAILENVLRANPANADALEEAGWVAADRWTLQANSAESTRVNLISRRHFDAALGVDPGRVSATLGRLATVKNEAYDLIKGAGTPGKAIPLLQDALAALRSLTVPPEFRDQSRVLEYLLLSKLGDATYYAGDEVGSLPLYQQAKVITQAELRLSPDSPGWLARFGEVEWNLSGVLEAIPGRREEALAEAERGIAALQRVLSYGPDANVEKKLAILLSQRGMLLSDMGRHIAAIGELERSISIRATRLAAEPADPVRVRDLAIAHMSFTGVLDQAGKFARACSESREAVALWSKIKRNGDLTVHDAKTNAQKASQALERVCR